MLKLTKHDAARLQLKTAIRLFFEERDPVSIHTLASADQEVFRDLLRARGIPSPSIKDTDRVKPEYKKLWLQAMNREQNFLKHADRDPDEILVFNPDIVPYVLYDDAVMYAKLTGGRMIREGAAFGMWFMLKNPQFLKSESLPVDRAQFEAARAHVNNRKAFLAMLDLREFFWPGLD